MLDVVREIAERSILSHMNNRNGIGYIKVETFQFKYARVFCH